MANRKVMDFYNGRYFEIPKYQRGYAWDKKNVRELFSDVFESIESNSSHYIGTIVLSRMPENDDRFYIVDGQQRITTITMIINQLIRHLTRKDADFYRRYYIKNESYKLKPLGKDKDFLIDLIRSKNRVPENKSQRLMQGAHEEIVNIIATIPDKKEFLKSIERMEVMEFIEDTEGDAIRIFQTVNDRGKPLSNMEKAKSLLIYFSNRYMAKKLDTFVNDSFGDIFEVYDQIKQIGEDNEISLINNADFNEDNMMRYHFIAFSDENYDATPTYVLDYLKRKLDEYRKSDKNNNYSNMDKFIQSYTSDLHEFFQALLSILKRTNTNEMYFKVFSILGLSAILYPITVKLEMLGCLDSKLKNSNDRDYTFLDIIELIDVRVYKTRGTNPRSEISNYTQSLTKATKLEDIEEWLLWYNSRWMSKEEFKTHLNGGFYGNSALPHIFIEYCESLESKSYTMKALKQMVKKKPTVEHILSQTPKFNPKAFKFKNDEEFLDYSDVLGNLTILEKSLNSKIQNLNPTEKVKSYDRSIFEMTRQLSSTIATKKAFHKQSIVDRTKQLSAFCSKRWWC